MAQSPLAVEMLDAESRFPVREKETRIYYRPHTVVTYEEAETGKEVIALTQEQTVKLRERIATGEVRRKETRTYIATTPLPADPWHMNHYARKGFKLWPPGQEPGQSIVDGPPEEVRVQASGKAISCPVADCTFIAKTFVGLARHMSQKHGQK